MTHIDDAIRQALSADDARVLEGYGADQSLPAQLAETFRGQMAWFNVIGWLAGFGLFAVALFLGWRFLTAPDVAQMLRWGAGAGLAVAGLALVKLWFWMELQKNAVLREVKRLELQVARLSAR